MGKVPARRRKSRSLRPSPVASGLLHSSPRKTRNDVSLDGNSESASTLLSSVPLPHDVDDVLSRGLVDDESLDDGSTGHKLRYWADELMTHMRGEKKSDRLYGTVLLTTGLTSGNRWQRLKHLLEREDESGDWLSKSEVMHLFSEIMSVLSPLLTDEDADVRLSAAESLRYRS